MVVLVWKEDIATRIDLEYASAIDINYSNNNNNQRI